MTEFRDTRQNARLDALERRVTSILEHTGIEDPVPPIPLGVSAQVAQLARAGRTMQAIKTHMEATGADLKSARDAVAAIPRTP
jgi:ribosomal protein L7/L12